MFPPSPDSQSKSRGKLTRGSETIFSRLIRCSRAAWLFFVLLFFLRGGGESPWLPFVTPLEKSPFFTGNMKPFLGQLPRRRPMDLPATTCDPGASPSWASVLLSLGDKGVWGCGVWCGVWVWGVGYGMWGFGEWGVWGVGWILPSKSL